MAPHIEQEVILESGRRIARTEDLLVVSRPARGAEMGQWVEIYLNEEDREKLQEYLSEVDDD